MLIKCFTHHDEDVGVPNNYEQGFGASDGHVEAFGVGQKAESTLQIITQYGFIRAHLYFKRMKFSE